MPRNVEIKARVADMPHLLKAAKRLSNEEGECLRQRDTFYRCSSGRLKLRSIKTEVSEVVRYRKIDNISLISSLSIEFACFSLIQSLARAG